MTTIEAEIRENTGKEKCKKLRDVGSIPAIMYGGDGHAPVNLAIQEKEFTRKVYMRNFTSEIINIEINKKVHRALTKEVQLHPVSDRPIHVDFIRIEKDSRISLAIKLNFMNRSKSPGLKKGAVLNIVQHSLVIKCNTNSIPKSIDIDLSDLDVGDSLKIQELNLPEGSTVPNHLSNVTIATIVAPSSLKAQEKVDSTNDNPSE